MEAVMRVHRLLVFVLAAAVLTGGCAGNSPTSPTAPTPTQPATPTPTPATPASSWVVTRAGAIVQAAYGSGTSYPQCVAFHASGYLRLVCGPGCTWGTSIVIVPALWAGGMYHQGAPTTASWTTENGDLLISYSATIAGLAVSGQVRVSPPGVDSISATVTVNVAALDEAMLTARPLPDKWSIREIVEHLVLADDDVVGDFSRLDALDAQPRGIGHHVRYLVVVCVLRSRIPVTAPSRAIFRHPISGPLSVSQALVMLDAHLDSHIHQIRRRMQLLRAAHTG